MFLTQCKLNSIIKHFLYLYFFPRVLKLRFSNKKEHNTAIVMKYFFPVTFVIMTDFYQSLERNYKRFVLQFKSFCTVSSFTHLRGTATAGPVSTGGLFRRARPIVLRCDSLRRVCRRAAEILDAPVLFCLLLNVTNSLDSRRNAR